MLVETACQVIKSLSIFYPNLRRFGDALIGLSIGKAVIFGVDSVLSEKSKKASFSTIDVFNIDHLQNSTITEFSPCFETASNDILSISKPIISQIKSQKLDEMDRKKFDRMISLTSKLGQSRWYNKIFSYGGGMLSFLTGLAAGISVTASGQSSPASYYLTLISGGVEAIVNNGTSAIGKNPAIHKYAILSEVVYLCDYFSGKLQIV